MKSRTHKEPRNQQRTKKQKANKKRQITMKFKKKFPSRFEIYSALKGVKYTHRRISILDKKFNLTEEQIGTILGLSRSAVAMYKSGKRGIRERREEWLEYNAKFFPIRNIEAEVVFQIIPPSEDQLRQIYQLMRHHGWYGTLEEFKSAFHREAELWDKSDYYLVENQSEDDPRLFFNTLHKILQLNMEERYNLKPSEAKKRITKNFKSEVFRLYKASNLKENVIGIVHPRDINAPNQAERREAQGKHQATHSFTKAGHSGHSKTPMLQNSKIMIPNPVLNKANLNSSVTANANINYTNFNTRKEKSATKQVRTEDNGITKKMTQSVEQQLEIIRCFRVGMYCYNEKNRIKNLFLPTHVAALEGDDTVFERWLKKISPFYYEYKKRHHYSDVGLLKIIAHKEMQNPGDWSRFSNYPFPVEILTVLQTEHKHQLELKAAITVDQRQDAQHIVP